MLKSTRVACDDNLTTARSNSKRINTKSSDIPLPEELNGQKCITRIPIPRPSPTKSPDVHHHTIATAKCAPGIPMPTGRNNTNTSPTHLGSTYRRMDGGEQSRNGRFTWLVGWLLQVRSEPARAEVQNKTAASAARIP